MCIFSKILKNTISYQQCDICIGLRDRELNHVLLNTFLNERKWNFQDGGLKPEVDTAKRLFPFPLLIATRFQQMYICWNHVLCPMFSGSAIPMGHVYTVRLNWEETGSAKSKMAACTHEMRIFQLPD